MVCIIIEKNTPSERRVIWVRGSTTIWKSSNHSEVIILCLHICTLYALVIGMLFVGPIGGWMSTWRTNMEMQHWSNGPKWSFSWKISLSGSLNWQVTVRMWLQVWKKERWESTLIQKSLAGMLFVGPIGRWMSTLRTNMGMQHWFNGPKIAFLEKDLFARLTKLASAYKNVITSLKERTMEVYTHLVQKSLAAKGSLMRSHSAMKPRIEQRSL
jgi:hypothetical protein